MSADRGAFICQSQSLNIHLASPTFAQLTSCHFFAWKKGLKTGCYYLRTKPAVGAIQFTVSADTLKEAKDANATAKAKKANGVESLTASVGQMAVSTSESFFSLHNSTS